MEMGIRQNQNKEHISTSVRDLNDIPLCSGGVSTEKLWHTIIMSWPSRYLFSIKIFFHSFSTIKTAFLSMFACAVLYYMTTSPCCISHPSVLKYGIHLCTIRVGALFTGYWHWKTMRGWSLCVEGIFRCCLFHVHVHVHACQLSNTLPLWCMEAAAKSSVYTVQQHITCWFLANEDLECH